GSGKVGMVCELGRDIELHDVRLDVEEGPAFRFSNSELIRLDNIASHASLREPVVALHNTRSVWLQNSRAYPGNRTFVQLQGGASRDIHISENELSASSTPVMIGPDVPAGACLQD
ncbi:MAG TPA: hypothetical protein VK995_03060, partial [Oceanipulchritudo sp.]|nr:hypothetical protein [Oceanipulchritudo sp.]